MTAFLEISDLKVQRGDQPALQLDYLSIEREEKLAVVGPNGAGKSTLLLVLARLLQPGKGRICYQGRPIDSEPETSYRRRVALVLQEPLLFDSSVFDNVAAGLRFRGVSKGTIQRRVLRWLDQLGVAHLAKRRAGELSGGEAQRVSLARALVLEPELLLLDEPFSSLDPPTREAILDDLEALLQQTATTTIFVTHDLREAIRLSDRIALVIHNRLRQVGPIEQVRREPADAEVVDFLRHSR